MDSNHFVQLNCIKIFKNKKELQRRIEIENEFIWKFEYQFWSVEKKKREKEKNKNYLKY